MAEVQVVSAPYFGFLDPDSGLYFEWDGRSSYIQVVQRDLGPDQVTQTFQVSPRSGIANASAERWMEWFKLVCCNYIRLKVGEGETE
jgi:hypothetical protein